MKTINLTEIEDFTRYIVSGAIFYYTATNSSTGTTIYIALLLVCVNIFYSLYRQANDIEQFLMRAYAKGVIHGLVVPFFLMKVTNMLFDGNYGGLTAVVYLLVVGLIYLTSKEKDLSKRGFFYSVSGFMVLAFMYAILFGMSVL